MEERTAGGGADLLMECEEEEPEFQPQSPGRDEEEEEEEEEEEARDEALMEEEEEEEPPPVRIVPIPVQPVSRCSPPRQNPLQSPGVPLGFKVNGVFVSLLTGGGAELKLSSHPGGSACGFTTVRLGPVHIPAPAADPTPVITGVVSGEAAQRVLKSSLAPPSPAVPPQTSPGATAATSHRAGPPHSNRGPSVRHKPPHKGQQGPVPPPNCLICDSQYKLITELRGFMCLCSPVIAQSLKNLKRRNNHRRRKTPRNPQTFRDPQTCSSKVSRTRPAPPTKTIGLSDDFLSDESLGPDPPFTTWGPRQDQPDPPADPLRGKLVIMVEDFYYGCAPGRRPLKLSRRGPKFTGPYRCIHCPLILSNNISLMSHMQHHVRSMSQDGLGDAPPSCPHCFRHFLSPFKLQCHLEAVHSQYESTAKCKICELAFDSEASFLWHMKSTHKPGEMPYTCQVCDFRSSFYADVWSHFQELHADTKHLMCQYCLRVLRSNTCYQQHLIRHQRKHVFSCDKCRLHFLFVKERNEHKLLHHRTHIRPPQLTGLKPGTKVTVRTYSVVRGSEDEEGPKKRSPCKVVEVAMAPPTQEPPKRKPVERLGALLTNLSQDREAAGVSQRCIECLTWFEDFSSHFPSVVHCSLCRFITCCSTSYANHMISHHSACRKKPQYHNIFQSELRLSWRLKCASCTFSTYRGDVMANHMTERPEHHCILPTHEGRSVKTKNTLTDSSSSVTSSVSGAGGAFIPIHLLPSGQTSTQLSVKALTSPSPLSSPPAMTIKFLGPRPQPEQCPGSPLTFSQLSTVLFSLCHGLAQAARRHRTPPSTIRSWIGRRERQLSDGTWRWKTEKVAEWVLSQREQQLVVSEDVLLQTARRALGQDSQPVDRYGWTVDFMLRHELGVQPTDTDSTPHHRRRLPRNVRDNSRSFVELLSAQVHSNRVPPHCVASMDEFSIFLDSDQNPSVLQLFGSPGDKPVFDVVLCALSDGTFLPPLLFFRGPSSHVPEGFPDNVLLEARREGFSDQDRLRIWIDKVWRPHVASEQESVLMVDIHRGHLTDEFRTSLASVSTDVFFIPSACCCRLQPLDVCVTPVLRDFLQARWAQLLSQGGLDGLGLEQLALTLTCWLSEVSSTLNSERHVLQRSFASVCNLQEVEDRGEAARIIQALTEALIQLPEKLQPGPEPESEPELELLLLMEEKEEEQKEEELSQAFDGDSDQESFTASRMTDYFSH